MIKKKSLILSLVVILLNFPTQSFSYSLNNFQQLATLNQESGEGSSGSSSENSSGESSGESSEDSTGGEDGNLHVTEPVSDSVELDGAIGQWEPGNNQLPNFNADDLEVSENKPENGQYFTISATVPLQMDFLIKNENENGSSPNGKFITAYYKVKNNGSYPLYIEVESFETAQGTRTSDLVDKPLEKLYVEEPIKGNNKVEMRLHLTYDRPSNSYLNRVDLHNLNKNAKASIRTLGTIDPNEEARLYYGSDLWETPKSEDITTGVESTFKLKLAFSLKKDTNDNTNSEGNTDTGTEGNSDTITQ
ncbi:hypothetical protein [Clostridium sp.]|uniref:hypothetical protein n=1 Tax=Clostridium sp. TaxID=1506 RepID=UPI002607A95C|nr:hypothetical protein [Clostridium sp.]